MVANLSINRTLIDEVLRRWHHDIWEVGRWLGRVCEGWLNYFAVPGSGRFTAGCNAGDAGATAAKLLATSALAMVGCNAHSYRN